MFTEAIAAILDTHCTPAQVRAIEGGASAQPLAAALQEAGFFALLAPEAAGGGGAGWAGFHEVVTLCGARSVPIPLAQTLAARLLVQAQDELPADLVTFAPALLRAPDGALEAPLVPGGRLAAHVIAAAGDTLVLLPTAAAQQATTGVHGSSTASFRWPAGAGRPLQTNLPASQLQAIGAVLHAGLLAGGLKRAFDLTLAHASQRVQFGKPIMQFQAIQHQLAAMAEHVAAGAIAAEAAFATAAAFPSLPACAVAKARTSEAAQLVASIAHAVHGAIGITEEHDLQLTTRRLHEWRMAHGSETHWNRLLGRLFLASEQPLAVDFARTLC